MEFLTNYWTHIGFFLAIFSACMLFIIKMEKRKFFPIRVLLCLAVFHVIGYFVMPFFKTWAEKCPSIDWLIYFSVWIFQFVIVLGSLAFCFKEKFSRILFCGVAGYSCESMVFGLRTMSVLVTEWPFLKSTLTVILFYAICYPLIYLLLARKLSERIDTLDNFTTIIVSCILLFLIVFIGSAMQFSINRESLWILELFRFAFCAIALFILFGIADNGKKAAEIKTIHKMWEQDRAHFSSAKDLIGTINLKLHDLKYYAIKAKNSDSMDELLNNIKLYDADIKTGNSALDVILTEQTLKCYNKNIRITSMVNGKALSFMNDTDIYILFGNILDNAIEAVMQVEDKEKRNISVTVSSRENFVNIHCENYFSGNVEFENNLPKTTKSDKSLHGFGTQSIKLLVRKYDGNICMSVENNVFILDIMFNKLKILDNDSAS